jgi:hypothetical protein
MCRSSRRLAVVVAIAAALAGSATAHGLPGRLLLVNRPDLRVYGPPERADVPCISALSLPPDAPAAVKRAVALAMPPFEARLKLDGGNPSVHVAQASRSGFDYRAGGCGRATWARSIIAFVSLPRIRNSVSMSNHTFAVARTREGWVLWAWIQ